MLDSTKIRDTLGWTDRIDLNSGLDMCIKWVNDNFEELKPQPMNYVHKP